MAGWQKAITVIANVLPLILLFFFISIIMAVGCNYPVPSNKVSGYRASVIGAFIGDQCKNFDISTIGVNNNVAMPPTPTPTTSNPNASTTLNGVINPRGVSP